MWPLYAVVRGDVAPGLRGVRTAPGEPRFVNIGFQLGHAGSRRAFLNDVRPFRDHVKEHGALAVVHGGGLETLWLDDFAILSGAEDQVGKLEAQNGLLTLALIECLQ